jgi:hypothetical protein
MIEWILLALFSIIIFLIAYFYSGEDRSRVQYKRDPIIKIKSLEEKEWKTEAYCCKIAQEIFNVEFKKIRPDFLKSTETNRNLELDCYNEDLKIAIEYNGAQHYVYPNVFHKNKDAFLRYVRNDSYKRRMCDAQGIYLITIPYTVKKDKIKAYIIEKSKDLFDDD